MSFISPRWIGASLPWLELSSRPNPLRVACVCLLFVAIFSGRFSFARFVDESARVDWLELRIWFTALAALGCVVLQRQVGEKHFPLGKQVRLWLSVLAVLYGYLLANILVLGDTASLPQHVTDIVITAVQAFLVTQVVRSEDDLVWFALIAEAVGVVLFLFCIAGFGNPDVNGVGWAPFGGPTTFYRIQFLAFCCALYLFARGREPVALLHLFVAVIALFSALASLSKIAFIGSLATVAFLLFWLLSSRRWRQALILGLTVGLTFSAFSYLRGEIFVARVTDVSTPQIGLVDSAADPNWTIDLLRRIQSGEQIRLADLPAWQQRYIRPMVGGADADKLSMPAILESLSRTMVYQDNTGRARLWVHAWKLFQSSPWFGVGIGNYRFEQMNRYTKQIELYRYPHNLVLELAATVGIIGLCLFALLAFISLVLLQQRTMADSALLYAMGYPLFILVAAFVGGDYFDFRVFWLFTLVILAGTARGMGAAAARTAGNYIAEARSVGHPAG